MRFLFFLAGVILSSLPFQAAGAERWIRLTTPHFEMYTTNGEKQAVAALEQFEQTRYFFMQNSHSKTAPTFPVRIIAFRSAKEFKPYRANEGSVAYYLRGANADFIVMQDISSEHYQVVMHEYTHLIIAHNNMKVPLWLEEGMADLYSSMEPRGKQVLVGRAPAGSMALLRNEKWLDAKTLLAVDHDSPYYNESKKMSIFYAQSWALTHMLALGRSYQPRFGVFLSEVVGGRSVADSLRTAFGKTPDQALKDLHSYLDQSTLQAAVFDIKLEKQDLEPEVAEPSELQVSLTLIDLLASGERTRGQAEEQLAELAKAHPESAEVEESQGYLGWREGNAEKAKQDFKLAIDRGSKNPEVLLLYAELMLQGGTQAKEIMPLLESAVRIKPDFEKAWFDLGLAATQAGEWGRAVIAFANVRSVSAADAYRFFSAGAYCRLNLNAYGPAREAATKAKGYAADPNQIADIVQLLREIDQREHPELSVKAVGPATAQAQVEGHSEAPEKPTLRYSRELPRDVPMFRYSPDLQHVEAVTKWLDCDTATKRLHVLAGGKEVVLAMDDPDSINVRNTNGGFVDFQCGAQKPVKVGIFYIPGNGPGAIAGTVRELVY